MNIKCIYNNTTFQEPIVFEFPYEELVTNKLFTLLAQLEDPKRILKFVYRECNRVDGSEWISGKKLRSMSVGDMIMMDNVVYVCCMAGWKTIAELEKNVLNN